MPHHEYHELPPFAWPAILTFVMLAGLLGGALLRFVAMRSVTVGSGGVRSEAAAAAEATIAICSGALLWIGWWDVLDSYLVPSQWWAKLCMLLVGLVGVLATRSLYESPVRPPMHDDEGTSACVEDSHFGSPLPPALPAELSPRPRSIGGHDLEQASIMTNSWDKANDRRCCFCLQPPPFSSSTCFRALFATFAGLTMWVGLWDLIEDHLLPNLFRTCRVEPSLGCALVKLGLVGVGAVGLYLTRSLYGEQGISVQFQRL